MSWKIYYIDARISNIFSNIFQNSYITFTVISKGDVAHPGEVFTNRIPFLDA